MSADAEEDIHPHCLGCFKFTKCTAKPEPNVSCEIISCELGCGMKFHGCKGKEHRLLCPNEKVPCYNAESGCPCTMQRKFLPKHLITCPASVVHCTMEWNRWYIDLSTEERLQWCTNVLQGEQPQFDVALALRDQRILRRWFTSCKKSKNALRNHFKNYPLPLRVGYPMIALLDDTSKPNVPSTDESLHVAHAGLQSSVCNQLYHSGKSFNGDAHTTNTNGHDCDSVSMLDELVMFPDSILENKENFMKYLSTIKHCACRRSDCICPGEKSHKNGGDALYEKEVYERRDGEQGLQTNTNSFNESMATAILSYPTRYLGLGPRLESLLCFPQHTVNTFLCAEEFRRDEYPWHYKNVHSEIYDGLNGWLQERCPLAQYGCSFSTQRLHPTPKGSKIVFNQISESFGISYDEEAFVSSERSNDMLELPSHQEIYITELPFEVLQHIARFLDSFSLSNLSLTSSLMREVCQSLLVERGIVTLRWERRESKNNDTRWNTTQKCWSFSSHFTPVRDWIFGEATMANHLKSCKYFDRSMKTEPHFHSMGAPKDCAVYERLKKMSDSYYSENLTTKL